MDKTQNVYISKTYKFISHILHHKHWFTWTSSIKPYKK